jgi:hypothetical protein
MTSEHDTSHKHFSASYFNRAWELLEKADRTPDDDECMVSIGHASLAHWRDRPDCQQRNMSIGYWQLARIHAVLGRGENATHYGRLCLASSDGEPPFYQGYAYEALARAALLTGDIEAFRIHHSEAGRFASEVIDDGERKVLEDDLKELARLGGS